jgi:hypothetical protein
MHHIWAESAIFSSFYNISQPNFAISLLIALSSCADGFCPSCLDRNLVYTAGIIHRCLQCLSEQWTLCRPLETMH